jgi:hypothetical protein
MISFERSGRKKRARKRKKNLLRPILEVISKAHKGKKIMEM